LRRPTRAHHLHPRRMIGFFYMPTMGRHGGEWNTVKELEHKLTLAGLEPRSPRFTETDALQRHRPNSQVPSPGDRHCF